VWRNNGKSVVPVDPVVHRHAGNATPRINGLRLTPQRLIKFEAAEKKAARFPNGALSLTPRLFSSGTGTRHNTALESNPRGRTKQRDQRSKIMKSKLGRMIAIFVFGSFVAFAGQASAQQRTKVGTLRCNLAPTVGLIVIERQRLSCMYTPDGPWPPERYFGRITTVGLDLGVNRGGRMAWAVLAPVAGPIRGGLAGSYVGVSADAAVGVGLGANALVGGSNRSFGLQPLSVEANTGLDITAGVSTLRLRYAP
jgi:hypothetical protein